MPATRRIDGIDLLRALSIFLVLMNHVNMLLLGAHIPYLRSLPPQLASTLVWNGGSAVQMFFAISGFLITSTSIRRWSTPATLSIADFYRLRFARIAPLLLLLLLVLSCLHFAQVPYYHVKAATGGLPRALFAALTFHINYLEATRNYLPGNWDILWSLSVEEMFYLFFPLIARLLPRRRYLFILLGLFITAGPFARTKHFNPNPVWREYSYQGGMDAIAMGCLTAILLTGRQLSSTWQRVCGYTGTAILIFILSFSITAWKLGLGPTGLDATLLAIGTCLVIAAASQSHWHAPRVVAPLLAMGRHSYEIYLTHEFCVIGLFLFFTKAGSPLHAVPLLFLTVILTASLVGWFVAANYTEPMNRLLRKWLISDRHLRNADGSESIRTPQKARF